MGLTYSFHLCFPASRVADVLRATAAMADPIGESRVRLSDGATLTVPFTVRLESADVALNDELWTTLDASLWLPVDEEVRRYVDEWEADVRQENPAWRARTRETSRGQEAAIGYVYLTIGVGLEGRYALFSFTAATSNMSRLFQDSAAIRWRFDRLLRENGGFLGLLDQEWVLFPLLPDFTRHIVLDEELIQLTDADGWVAAALAAEVQGG